MQQQTEQHIQPISEIAGNIEITFNTKNKEIDEYEPLLEQLVLTIGKTGRANRLTFDQLDSQSVKETAHTLQRIAAQLKEMEERLEESKNQLDKESVVADAIKEKLDDGVKDKEQIKKKVSDECSLPEFLVEKNIENLKREGEMFSPQEGKLQKI